MRQRYAIALAAAMLGTAFQPSPDVYADEYFAGKTLTIIAGYRPGGGVDNNARLVGAHLGKHIPGDPNVINKNMPGAGGARLANWMFNKADKDGLTIALPGRSWMMSKLLKDPGVRYEPLEFDYIGSLGPVPYYLWVRADTGIKTLEELKKSKRPIVFGGLAQRASNYVVPALLAKNNWPVKALHGYKGTSNIMLAIEQKEVDGIYASTSTLRNNRGDLIDDKVIIPIAADAKHGRDLPVLPEHMTKETRGVFSLVTAPSTWGVPTIAPPGTRKEALDILRAAYLKMAKDQAFLADAAKRGILAEHPNSGDQVHARIKEVLEGADEDSVETYLGYVKRKK